MSKRKMCPKWMAGESIAGNKLWCQYRNNACPRNTNSRCEIVPRKPKMVRIRWGTVKDLAGYDRAITLNGATAIQLNPGTSLNVENMPMLMALLRKKCGNIEAKWLKGG